MSMQSTILLLAPTAAEQEQSHALAQALAMSHCQVQELVIDGNYDQVLDALTGTIVPVVVK